MDQGKNIRNVMVNNIKYKTENSLVQSIAKEAFKKYKRIFGRISVTKTKTGPADVVSEMDLSMDRLLNSRIKKQFPNDAIYSEEGSGDLDEMMKKTDRVWILDPICGSLNVMRGINVATTNVILLINGKVKAAWVFDYPVEKVIWSTGGNKIFHDNKKIPKLGKREDVWQLDVSKGYLHLFDKKTRSSYGKFIEAITFRKYTYLCNFGTSLTFTYVATGQFQGAVSFHVKSWDLLAACFLVEQNNGVVRNFDGSRWGIESKSVIIAGNKTIYRALYSDIQKLGKQTIVKLMK